MGTATTLSNADIKETAHILIHLLGDPELVRYFLRIYIPIERDYLLELARSFHTSLRLKPSDRWSRLNDLCEKKDFSKISPNSALPITCSLPIDGKRWRAQKEVLTAIDYMRGHFIRCVGSGFMTLRYDKTKFSEKVKLLNHIQTGRNILEKMKEIRDVYTDYLLWEMDMDDYWMGEASLQASLQELSVSVSRDINYSRSLELYDLEINCPHLQYEDDDTFRCNIVN